MDGGKLTFAANSFNDRPPDVWERVSIRDNARCRDWTVEDLEDEAKRISLILMCGIAQMTNIYLNFELLSNYATACRGTSYARNFPVFQD